MLQFFARRLKELHEVERDERGFTLIELLIVVIIIGILAAIAIPTFMAQRDKAVIATCESDTRNAAEAAVLYAADTATGDFAGITMNGGPPDLVSEGFNQTEGYVTDITLTSPTELTLTTDCPEVGSLGTATWHTTNADAYRGEVHFVAN